MRRQDNEEDGRVMGRFALTIVLALAILMHVSLIGTAQEVRSTATGTALATPISPGAEIPTELLASIRLPAAAIPPPPAIVDVWLWSVRPNEAIAFATGDAPPSIAADVVLAGEYSVRSDGRLQVQRSGEVEEVPPGTAVTVRPSDAVIYVENQAAQVMRNLGTDEVKAVSFGVYSTAPPWDYTEGPVSPGD